MLLLGAIAGWHLTVPGFGWVAALAAAGLALGGRRGFLVVCLAVGLTLPALGRCGRWSAPSPDTASPVELVGCLNFGWRRDDGIWKATLRVRRYRQGDAVVAWRQPVRLYSAADAAPAAASRVRVKGYVGRAPGHANLPVGGPGPWSLWIEAPVFYRVEAGPGLAMLWRGAVRARLLGAVGEGSRGGVLLRSLLLGDGGVLSEEVSAGLRRFGLLHLFAVSGLHVGMVAALALLLPVDRRRRFILALLLVIGYLGLVGPRPSLIRATVMSALAFAALLTRRPPAAANALAVAVAVMVLCEPRVLADVGFQLSVAATAGLLWIAPALAAGWTALPRWLGLSLATTVAAQLAALPVSAPVFHLWPLLSPLANLLYVPWTALALTGCLGWAALAAVAPTAAAGCRAVLDLLAEPYQWLAWVPAGWSGAVPVAWGVLGSSVVAATCLAALRRPKLAALPAAFILWLAFTQPVGHEAPELVVWDVGQGASVLLRDGPRTVLVDGGGWRSGDLGGRVLLPALARDGVRRLDAMVLTHPDLDHCGGLVNLARLLPVAELWASPGWDEAPCWRELRGVPGPRLRYLVPRDRLAVGRWRLKVLAPATAAPLAGNDRSLVVLARARGRRVLIPGDIEAGGESSLIERLTPAALRADVLIVPHHGSRTSSTPAFLAAVAPRLAIIPVGLRNRYHHPSEDVVGRLTTRDVRILRTDRDGMIRIRVRPGGTLRIELPASPRDTGH